MSKESVELALKYELCWNIPEVSLSQIKSTCASDNKVRNENTVLTLLSGQKITVRGSNVIHWLFLIYKDKLKVRTEDEPLIREILDNPNKRLLYEIN